MTENVIMNIYFISDLHLQESAPHITQLFLNFLREHTGKIHSLYILGDFFEYWIGDDAMDDFHNQIVEALADFATNTPVYFMHGNRDFLIGKAFAKQANCQILPDPSVIDIFGRPTIITHGDGLCTRDYSHIRYRKIASNAVVKLLFLALPLMLRQRIAMKMRSKSKQHQQSLDKTIMDVTPEEIPKLMAKYNVDQLIHGHTHRPCIENFSNSRRIVLSDWGKQGNALVCRPDGNVELTYFD